MPLGIVISVIGIEGNKAIGSIKEGTPWYQIKKGDIAEIPYD